MFGRAEVEVFGLAVCCPEAENRERIEPGIGAHGIAKSPLNWKSVKTEEDL